MQVLLSLWNDGKHQQALDMLIPIMLRCSPGADEAKIRAGLRFNGGRLEYWNLSGCNLSALPEEFGTVRTTGDLVLRHNQLESLPESFANVTVGGDLFLKGFGGDIGPAMAKAATLCYRNVKGDVCK